MQYLEHIELLVVVSKNAYVALDLYGIWEQVQYLEYINVITFHGTLIDVLKRLRILVLFW